jgi:hypothetical protein
MAYKESSSTEFPSVYDTGRTTADPTGMMKTPAMAHAGTATHLSARVMVGSKLTTARAAATTKPYRNMLDCSGSRQLPDEDVPAPYLLPVVWRIRTKNAVANDNPSVEPLHPALT